MLYGISISESGVTRFYSFRTEAVRNTWLAQGKCRQKARSTDAIVKEAIRLKQVVLLTAVPQITTG